MSTHEKIETLRQCQTLAGAKKFVQDGGQIWLRIDATDEHGNVPPTTTGGDFPDTVTHADSWDFRIVNSAGAVLADSSDWREISPLFANHPLTAETLDDWGYDDNVQRSTPGTIGHAIRHEILALELCAD